MKVQLIHLVDEGVYLLEQNTWPVQQLQVDGLPVKPPAVLQDPSRLERLVPGARVVDHYIDAEGSRRDSKLWCAERDRLLGRADADGDFDNLDDEYAFKKFEARWSPVYVEEPARVEPVEYEVVEIRVNSGDPHIRSLWNSPHVEHDRRLYRVNQGEVAHDAAIRLAKEHGLALDIPSHSGLRFAKAEGQYIYDDQLDFSRARPFIGTLEQCKAEKKRVLALVEPPLMAAAAKKRGTRASPALLGELRQQLATAVIELRRLQLKQSSVSRSLVAKPLEQALAAVDAEIQEKVA